MLSERIKQARIEAGLSQRQLCGEEITRNMLSLIESGRAKPSMQTLIYLAQRLQKPVSWFLEEETVSSPNQQLMVAARHSYAQEQYLQCLEQLEKYRGQDPLFDQEQYLLRALSLLALARQALAEEKLVYARSLLEKVSQVGKNTCYYTPAMERERLLLLYRAKQIDAQQIADCLPDMDEELLLRAQAYLDRGEYTRCIAMLSAAVGHSARWHYLSGQAQMGQKQYGLATEHFIQAEETYPQPCAQALEVCYRELENYKMAYHYACKQRK